MNGFSVPPDTTLIPCPLLYYVVCLLTGTILPRHPRKKKGKMAVIFLKMLQRRFSPVAVSLRWRSVSQVMNGWPGFLHFTVHVQTLSV